MRRSSVCTACSNMIRSSMPLGYSFRPRSLPLQSLFRQQNVLRAPFSWGTFSQLDSQGKASSPNVISSIETPNFKALEERILSRVLATKSLPSEKEVLLALQACQSFAVSQLQTSIHAPPGASPTSALLSLDESRIVQAVQQPPPPSCPPSPSRNLPCLPTAVQPVHSKNTVPSKRSLPINFEPLTDLAYRIVSHPDIFITIPILTSYVSLQSLIRDPAPIPAVFSLYANKSFTPSGSSKPLHPNPNQIKYAIPSDIAYAALEAAIEAKDMSICLDIIDTSYCAPAFQRARLARRASPGAVAACLAPATIYTLADIMAGYQDEVDHSIAVKYAFTGIFAYVFLTGSVGMVALMTSNDQMGRVTWIVGTPLKYRWLREEERAAFDKVAQAWGFTNPNKRGFEEGDEWELLREVVNRKGMYLDNPALMEGMQ